MNNSDNSIDLELLYERARSLDDQSDELEYEYIEESEVEYEELQTPAEIKPGTNFEEYIKYLQSERGEKFRAIRLCYFSTVKSLTKEIADFTVFLKSKIGSNQDPKFSVLTTSSFLGSYGNLLRNALYYLYVMKGSEENVVQLLSTLMNIVNSEKISDTAQQSQIELSNHLIGLYVSLIKTHIRGTKIRELIDEYVELHGLLLSELVKFMDEEEYNTYFGPKTKQNIFGMILERLSNEKSGKVFYFVAHDLYSCWLHLFGHVLSNESIIAATQIYNAENISSNSKYSKIETFYKDLIFKNGNAGKTIATTSSLSMISYVDFASRCGVYSLDRVSIIDNLVYLNSLGFESNTGVAVKCSNRVEDENSKVLSVDNKIPCDNVIPCKGLHYANDYKGSPGRLLEVDPYISNDYMPNVNDEDSYEQFMKLAKEDRIILYLCNYMIMADCILNSENFKVYLVPEVHLSYVKCDKCGEFYFNSYRNMLLINEFYKTEISKRGKASIQQGDKTLSYAELDSMYLFREISRTDGIEPMDYSVSGDQVTIDRQDITSSLIKKSDFQLAAENFMDIVRSEKQQHRSQLNLMESEQENSEEIREEKKHIQYSDYIFWFMKSFIKRDFSSFKSTISNYLSVMYSNTYDVAESISAYFESYLRLAKTDATLRNIRTLNGLCPTVTNVEGKYYLSEGVRDTGESDIADGEQHDFVLYNKVLSFIMRCLNSNPNEDTVDIVMSGVLEAESSLEELNRENLSKFMKEQIFLIQKSIKDLDVFDIDEVESLISEDLHKFVESESIRTKDSTEIFFRELGELSKIGRLNFGNFEKSKKYFEQVPDDILNMMLCGICNLGEDKELSLDSLIENDKASLLGKAKQVIALALENYGELNDNLKFDCMSMYSQIYRCNIDKEKLISDSLGSVEIMSLLYDCCFKPVPEYDLIDCSSVDSFVETSVNVFLRYHYLSFVSERAFIKQFEKAKESLLKLVRKNIDMFFTRTLFNSEFDLGNPGFLGGDVIRIMNTSSDKALETTDYGTFFSPKFSAKKYLTLQGCIVYEALKKNCSIDASGFKQSSNKNSSFVMHNIKFPREGTPYEVFPLDPSFINLIESFFLNLTLGMKYTDGMELENGYRTTLPAAFSLLYNLPEVELTTITLDNLFKDVKAKVNRKEFESFSKIYGISIGDVYGIAGISSSSFVSRELKEESSILKENPLLGMSVLRWR